MALWHVWDLEPFAPFGFNDVLGDVDRDLRRVNRELNRLGRDFIPALGNSPAMLFDRNVSILPNIVVDASGQRQAQFQFDTRGFKPEDITIKTENGNKLVICGKCEDKGEDYHRICEFRRMALIPEGTNADQMQSRLSPQGILTVQAPYNPPTMAGIETSQDKILPVKHERAAGQAQKA